MMPLNVVARVKNMTRETKLGLLVSCSFLCLLGVVLVLKMTERPEQDQQTADAAAPAPNEAPPDHQPGEEGQFAKVFGPQSEPPEQAKNPPGTLHINDDKLLPVSGATPTPASPGSTKTGTTPSTESADPVPPLLPPTAPPSHNAGSGGGNSGSSGHDGGTAVPPKGDKAPVSAPPLPPAPAVAKSSVGWLSGAARLAARKKTETGGGVPPLPPVSPPPVLTPDPSKVAQQPPLPPVPAPTDNKPSPGGDGTWLGRLARSKAGRVVPGTAVASTGGALPPPPPPVPDKPATPEKKNVPPLPDLPPVAGTPSVPPPPPDKELALPPVAPPPAPGNEKKDVAAGGAAKPLPSLPPAPGTKPDMTEEIAPPPPPPVDVTETPGTRGTGSGPTKPPDPVPSATVTGIEGHTGDKTVKTGDRTAAEPKAVAPRPPSVGEPEPIRVGEVPTTSVPPLSMPSAAPGVRSSHPDVVSYTEETFVAAAGDTFTSISKAKYGSDRYAHALYLFNRSHPLGDEELLQSEALRPKQTVYVPPHEILDSRYAPSVKGGVTVDSTSHRADVAAPAARSYRVAAGGEKVYDIARNLLGNGDRWVEIQALNPGWDWGRPLPAGATIQVPGDARLPR